MSIHIISKGFGDRFNSLLDETLMEINIISPFIGRNTGKSFANIIETIDGMNSNIITRFNREEFIQGASSLDGLERLLQAGAKLYALQNLHTKLYIFDNKSVIMGSANFTFNGFFRNHEFGMCMEDESEFAQECTNYFFGLLNKIVKMPEDWEITQEKIDSERIYVNNAIANRRKNDNIPNIVKWGARIDEVTGSQEKSHSVLPEVDFIEKTLKADPILGANSGIWIKFEGGSDNGIPNDLIYMDRKRDRYEYINRTNFHRRPTGIKNGQTVFMAVISWKDNTNQGVPIIVGYAESKGFLDSNIMTNSDLRSPDWIKSFPYYIELQNGKFIKAPIKFGISLNDLCRELNTDLYPGTIGKKNISFESIMSRHHQKSHIQITSIARDYLIDQLEALFKLHGYEEL